VKGLDNFFANMGNLNKVFEREIISSIKIPLERPEKIIEAVAILLDIKIVPIKGPEHRISQS